MSWGHTVQHGDYNTAYLNVAEIVDLKSSSQEKNNLLICKMMKLTRLVVIISQCIRILNHYVVHLELI